MLADLSQSSERGEARTLMAARCSTFLASESRMSLRMARERDIVELCVFGLRVCERTDSQHHSRAVSCPARSGWQDLSFLSRPTEKSWNVQPRTCDDFSSKFTSNFVDFIFQILFGSHHHFGAILTRVFFAKLSFGVSPFRQMALRKHWITLRSITYPVSRSFFRSARSPRSHWTVADKWPVMTHTAGDARLRKCFPFLPSSIHSHR